MTKLNQRAARVAAKHQIPVLDLNAVVHAQCGASYANCSLCDDESKYMGIRCGRVPPPGAREALDSLTSRRYHYASAGVELLASAVAKEFESLLA